MKKTIQITVGGIILIMVSLFVSTGCRAGWDYHNETHYKCLTKYDTRYEMCINVTDSANTPNYHCEKGKILEEEVPLVKPIKSSSGYVCYADGCEPK